MTTTWNTTGAATHEQINTKAKLKTYIGTGPNGKVTIKARDQWACLDISREVYGWNGKVGGFHKVAA